MSKDNFPLFSHLGPESAKNLAVIAGRMCNGNKNYHDLGSHMSPQKKPGELLVDLLGLTKNAVVYVHTDFTITKAEEAFLSQKWEKMYDKKSWKEHAGMVKNNGWNEIERPKWWLLKLIGEGYYDFINFDFDTGEPNHYEKNGEHFYKVARYELIKDKNTGNNIKRFSGYYRVGTNYTIEQVS